MKLHIMFEILEKDLTKESLWFSSKSVCTHLMQLWKESLKKSCLKGIQAHEICDTGVVLLPQTYHASWELHVVTLKFSNKNYIHRRWMMLTTSTAWKRFNTWKITVLQQVHYACTKDTNKFVNELPMGQWLFSVLICLIILITLILSYTRWF